METEHDPDIPGNGSCLPLFVLLVLIGLILGLAIGFANWARSVDEDLKMLKESLPTTKK
jgi:hypothetical protein